MNEMTMRKHLLENVTKMLDWISEEFRKADCDVTLNYKFEHGFIYGHSCDFLSFVCSKDAKFQFCHYGSHQTLRSGKLYREGCNTKEEYTQEYLTNPNWYIPKENAEGFEKAMREWTKVKSAVWAHIEKVNNVANFEV